VAIFQELPVPEPRASFRSACIRIGAVAYLNARPLVFGLEQLAPRAEVVVDLPSRLADGLADGRLDVAIVPSIEYLRQPGSMIVSDACIACDGPVRSVMLYGRTPVDRIRTLALDEGSRTSAALARILLKERFGREPQIEPLPIGATLDDTRADAVMLIGDRGMRPPGGKFSFVWDLGAEWWHWTGLPFVFAVWVARPAVDLRGIDRALAAARDEGVTRLPEIARQAAPRIGVPEEECLEYLRDHLEFRLGPRQREGLGRFYELAVRNGLAVGDPAPEAAAPALPRELVFYGQSAAD
jgi:chorismate dehydratase